MRIFTAPLNSEVEVARNVHDVVKVLGPGKGKDVKVCGELVASKARSLIICSRFQRISND